MRVPELESEDNDEEVFKRRMELSKYFKQLKSAQMRFEKEGF